MGKTATEEEEDRLTQKKPHRLMVPLPATSAALLRETAALASYTQAELITAIETSRQFAVAVDTVLREKYMERLKQGERLFAKPGAKEFAEAPIERVE